MTPHCRAAAVARYLDHVAAQWWAWPIRGRLDRLINCALQIAEASRRMQRELSRTQKMLDEIADDAREQAMLREAAHLALTCDSPTALAELDRVVSEFLQGKKP